MNSHLRNFFYSALPASHKLFQSPAYCRRLYRVRKLGAGIRRLHTPLFMSQQDASEGDAPPLCMVSVDIDFAALLYESINSEDACDELLPGISFTDGDSQLVLN